MNSFNTTIEITVAESLSSDLIVSSSSLIRHLCYLISCSTLHLYPFLFCRSSVRYSVPCPHFIQIDFVKGEEEGGVGGPRWGGKDGNEEKERIITLIATY